MAIGATSAIDGSKTLELLAKKAEQKFEQTSNDLGIWEQEHKGASRDESKHSELKANVQKLREASHTAEYKATTAKDKTGQNQTATNPAATNPEKDPKTQILGANLDLAA